MAPWLAEKEVYLGSILVGKQGHKGGIGRYPRAQRDILVTLNKDRGRFVTTMFDFYGMPPSWPGREEAGRSHHDRKASIIEKALSEDIANKMDRNFDPRRFLPYVQMYEFEALLFSRPKAIADAAGEPGLAQSLSAIREEFQSPELINDHPETAPSKRIKKLYPGYQKPVTGAIAAQKIGIEAMLSECFHFQEWVRKLINTET
ncbi:MAG: DUF4276 family protein [Planctomycetota bacterium]|nr:DUF4276 family protein [Planctomycetota bacterium]